MTLAQLFQNLREFQIEKKGIDFAENVIPRQLIPTIPNNRFHKDGLAIEQAIIPLWEACFEQIIRFGDEPEFSDKRKQCTPGKSFPCKSICLPTSKRCLHPLKGQAVDYAKFLELHKNKSGTQHFKAKATKTTLQKSQLSEEEKSIRDLVGKNIKAAHKENQPIKPNSIESKKQIENKSEFPLMEPKEIYEIGSLSNVGNYMTLRNQEILTNKNDVEKKLEQQIKSSKTRLATPGLVVETGDEDSYKTIDDGFSDKLNNASVSAGKQTTANIVVPNEKKQVDVAKALQVPDKNSKLFFVPKSSSEGISNVGNLMRLHAEEITSSGDKKHASSDSKVEKVAKQLREAGGNNWVPVLVKQTGDDKYEVVGNHFAYDVAKKANISRIRAVIVG